jgi:hypothetical protein
MRDDFVAIAVAGGIMLGAIILAGLATLVYEEPLYVPRPDLAFFMMLVLVVLTVWVAVLTLKELLD